MESLLGREGRASQFFFCAPAGCPPGATEGAPEGPALGPSGETRLPYVPGTGHQGRKPVAQAGLAQALRGWPASVAAPPSSHPLDKCWTRPWGRSSERPVRPGPPGRWLWAQGSMGTSWGVARAGMRGTVWPTFVTGAFTFSGAADEGGAEKRRRVRGRAGHGDRSGQSSWDRPTVRLSAWRSGGERGGVPSTTA